MSSSHSSATCIEVASSEYEALTAQRRNLKSLESFLIFGMGKFLLLDGAVLGPGLVAGLGA